LQVFFGWVMAQQLREVASGSHVIQSWGDEVDIHGHARRHHSTPEQKEAPQSGWRRRWEPGCPQLSGWVRPWECSSGSGAPHPALNSPATTPPRCYGSGHYGGFRNRRRAGWNCLGHYRRFRHRVADYADSSDTCCS